ncbi:MAG: hypothetical protein ACI8PZ_006966 [Myxococcota bacterium]|jgi:hypothetical protein
MRAMVACMLLAACGLIEPPPEQDCRERTAAWPDEDGDGIGDPGDIYVGCSPPAGWVTVPPADPASSPTTTTPPTTTPTGDTAQADTAPPADSAATVDTSGDTVTTTDTAVPETGDTGQPGDSAPR